VRLISGEPRAGEHHALRWCDADAASELDWAEADRPLIAPLLMRLRRTDLNRSGDSE
jgi:8-oxo-dGTP pyrophosphatase MutT (NUDIX family)